MDIYSEKIEALKQSFASSVLTTQIVWLLLILIGFSVVYHHRKNYNFKKPLAALFLVGGLYNIYAIIMKYKANVLLNSFQPNFVNNQSLGQPFVDEAIDLIWINGVVRSGILVAMTIGIILILNLRFRKRIFAPLNPVYGFVLGLFVCSILITLLKYRFESIFELFSLK